MPVGEHRPSLLSPDAYADGCPYEFLDELRDLDAVSWQGPTIDPSLIAPEVTGGWWVHRYDELREVLRSPQAFSSERRGVVHWDADEDTNAAMKNMLINMDPPLHSKHRRLVSAAFTPRRVAELEPRIEQIAASVVDAVARTGSCDAVHDLAAPMPMTVIAELLGVPERAAQLFDASNRMVGAVEVEDPQARAAEAATASIEMQLLGQELAVEKRARPDDSLLSAYVNGGLDVEGGHAGSTDDEVGWFLLLLSTAGNETVRTATVQGIRLLAEHPSQRDVFVDDIDGRLAGVIDEVLRFKAPLRSVRRTTTEVARLGETVIDEDAKVICHFSSALRDERQFENADRFDITRPSPPHHLAFGYGEHYCLGANLARLQLRTIYREIYTRIPDIHPVGPAVPQPNVQFEGLLSMPVAFTPEGGSST